MVGDTCSRDRGKFGFGHFQWPLDYQALRGLCIFKGQHLGDQCVAQWDGRTRPPATRVSSSLSCDSARGLQSYNAGQDRHVCQSAQTHRRPAREWVPPDCPVGYYFPQAKPRPKLAQRPGHSLLTSMSHLNHACPMFPGGLISWPPECPQD